MKTDPGHTGWAASTTKAAMPVNPEVAEAIHALTDALNRHYGCDYGYTIMGHGSILAASSITRGHVGPRILEEK